MQIIDMDIGLIRPYLKNAKLHSKKQIAQVAKSIERYGFIQPLVVDENNECVIGHCRLASALSLNLKKIPVLQLKNLTTEEIKALRLLDNKLNESDWDMDLVIEELKDLSPEVLEFTGFSSDLIAEEDEP